MYGQLATKDQSLPKQLNTVQTVEELPRAESIDQKVEAVAQVAVVDRKYEHDHCRDALSNVNQTLRFQISLAVPLMAACVTMLNIVPPQAHQELINEFDRWVFLPALISIGIGLHGLERHWYFHKKLGQRMDDFDELYDLIRYKNKIVRIVISLQATALVLMMVFVLLEYK